MVVIVVVVRAERAADVHERQFRDHGPSLFEPHDRLVAARLQQMHVPYAEIEMADSGIAGTEPDSLLFERDDLL